MTLGKAAGAGVPAAPAAVGFLLGALTLAFLLPCSCSKPSRGPESAMTGADRPSPVPQAAGRGPGSGILKLLGLEPSAESVDYVRNKTQFQLHTLLTEQRHPKTWNLDKVIAKDTLAGLRMLSDVDGDIRTKLEGLAEDTASLDAAAGAVEAAVLGKRKIYVYGCGATGRLAKQMESAFWRPLWRRVRGDGAIWPKLRDALDTDVEGELIGEMTGADRALISSLEGFEDLPLIGRLQLEDRGVRKGDVVICVTEGGETSSVIGTILAAHAQWAAEPGYDPAESRKNLYFVYNNPDDRLMPFDRSRRVLEEPGITKINLTTGPQAVTGSTRMQATTIETYVVGTVLEAAAGRVLARFLSPREMAGLGFPERFSTGVRLREFGEVLEAARPALPSLAGLTDLESRTYAGGHYSTYFAGKGLITVFIDSTERSPTFRLFPLDTVREPGRKCWIQVWTGAGTAREAWGAFLGRPFRGLDPERYRGPFEREIDDPYLKRAALESLKKAGDDQQDLYDFSIAGNERRGRGPGPGDLGVMVAVTPEEREFAREGSPFRGFMDLFARDGVELAVLLVTDAEPKAAEESVRRAFRGKPEALRVTVARVSAAGDPFGLKQQVAAKMLLNAHSTAVMAKLGKVVGNTMTNVSPSNLKLIGRATFLIQSHVNDALGRASWAGGGGAKASGGGTGGGERPAVTYAEANAVLFDSIAYLKDRQKEAGQTAEVALSIIRILESFKRGQAVGHDEALEIVRTVGLANYLAK
jgi:N-acetylmuramic acid 6-phosphate (MurNAc-6-P) etherase